MMQLFENISFILSTREEKHLQISFSKDIWLSSSLYCAVIMDFSDSLSPFIHFNHPLLLAALLNYILCLYKAIVYKVLVGQPILVRLCERVHRRTSLMNLSLLFKKCPYLACLIWMFLQIGGRWPYSCCFVGCCFQDFFNRSCSILAQFPSSFSSIRLVSVHVMHSYIRIDTIAAWRKLHFIFIR